MRAVDTTWVRVQPDGGESTEETLAPGAVREWRSAGRFHVTLGNAGGVELELDGRALPALGSAGQVVRDATVPGESSREVPVGPRRAPPDGLGKTRAAFEEGFARIFQGQELQGETVEDLESLLLQADLGLDTAEAFVERVREQSRAGASPTGMPGARCGNISARPWPAPGRRSTSTRVPRSCSSSA